jgi:hypothetical protein
MSQWVKISFVLCTVGILFSTCSKDPSYPIIPGVTDARIVTKSGNLADVVFNFTDGDGDIGWPTNDSLRAQKDVILKYQQLQNGVWVDQSDFEYEFQLTPSLTPIGQDKFLEGEVSVEIAYPPPPPGPVVGDTIRFGVILKDRAAHASMLVYSPQKVL